MNLIKAIRAAEAYAAGNETRPIEITAARSMDLANRWYRVEGVRRSFRRIYVVDCSTPNGYVVEVVGGSQMDEAALITYAIAQRTREAV